MTKGIALFLEHSSNAYMQETRTEAEDEARRYDLTVETFYADSRFLQIQQLYSVLRDERKRPAAIAIAPLCVDGFDRAARSALRFGMDWICLHRPVRELAVLRREAPGSVVGFVTPDQREIGRTQARLAGTIAPRGRVLYVQGSEESLSAHERLTGFREEADGEILGTVDGNWTADDARVATERWFTIKARALPALDVIVCQNDSMATGVIAACRAQAVRLGRPELAWTPVIGCDGAASEGQRLVDEGQLAATVMLQGVGREAVRMVGERLQGRPSRTDVILTPAPYGLPEVRHTQDTYAVALSA